VLGKNDRALSIFTSIDEPRDETDVIPSIKNTICGGNQKDNCLIGKAIVKVLEVH